MKYNVKLGNMYIKYIYLDNNLYTNNFVREIEFDISQEKALKIREEDKANLLIILGKVLGMEYTIESYITFEEVKENE